MAKRAAFRLFFSPLSFILSLFPSFIKRFLFDCFSGCPTIMGVAVRYVLLKSMCEEVGYNVYIGRWAVLKNCHNLRIGDNVSLHDYCYVDAIGGVVIKDNVSIAHASSIVSFEHTWGDVSKPIKYNNLQLKPIHIDNDVWIGAGVRILSGVKIDSRVIVGAGSVVKGHLKTGYIYGGVPCKAIMVLEK